MGRQERPAVGQEKKTRREFGEGAGGRSLNGRIWGKEEQWGRGVTWSTEALVGGLYCSRWIA